MERLLGILSACCPTVDFSAEKQLITGKVIDSIDLVSIISDIEDEFDVSIEMDQIDASNFDSAEEMWKLIRSLQ